MTAPPPRTFAAASGQTGFLAVLDELLEEMDEFEEDQGTRDADPEGTAAKPDGGSIGRRPAFPGPCTNAGGRCRPIVPRPARGTSRSSRLA